MKFALVLVAIFGVACAMPAHNTYSLKDDLEEFKALLPIEDIKALYHKYENDEEVKKVVAYLKSDDFAAVVHIVAHVPEVEDLVNWIDSKGIDIIDFLNRIADRLGLPHWPGSFKAQITVQDTRGWRDFYNELIALLPLDDIIDLVLDKLANSPDFQELYEKIANLDYQKFHDNASSHPEYVDMINRLKALGVDVQKIWDFIKNIFDWAYSTRNFSTFSLKDDLDELKALLPIEDIKALYHKYENDEEVKKVVAYLKSDDFAAVVHIVAHVPEVEDLVNWIDSKGVDIIDFLNKIADRLGLPHWPGSFKGQMTVRDTRGWRDFYNELKDLLPLEDIMGLVLDKLANSADFQELYEKIANLDYQKLHDNALSHPEIVDMINRLKALGVDVQKVWDFIKNIFGWTY